MTTKPIKIGATIAVVVLALSGLLYATLSEGTEYYKHVDEVMTDPSAWHGKRLQLHGYVVDKSIRRKPNTLEYLFDIQSNGRVVQARYTGVVPDTFKDGSEVVLKGKLGPDGFHVDRNGVMAKCPSKYEPAKGSLPSAGSGS
jgi:cytochrome c-type biogenesis protein CcmE